MRNEPLSGVGGAWGGTMTLAVPAHAARQAAISVLLVLALLAFELFNFDTTRYALRDLLGNASFAGLGWATILAIAFCAIDFAGLAWLFAPEREQGTWSESWYLMGAWLLGATMNALMTWWAVNLTLLNHPFGNEVLSREQLLEVVPPFVAVLVWLTRILFIGAFSLAGDHLFDSDGTVAERPSRQRLQQPVRPVLAGQPRVAAARAQAVEAEPQREVGPANHRPVRREQRPPIASMVSARPGRHPEAPIMRR
ncbi:MAG: hypothetical protein RRC07_15755 [Anaerolineae bacterium]|nr:hypothetical protein [Anaerolineae bacterium]